MIVAATLATASYAQVTLPTATFKLDFEGATSVADFNGTQVGDGELRQSDDPNFGTYYQNCPNNAVATKATNYLRVELGDGLTKAGANGNYLSLSFWVNPTVANTVYPSISYYWSVLYSIYTANNRGLTSTDGWNGPMWSQNVRGWAQINDWADRWDDFSDDENVNGSNVWDITWLEQKTETVITTDDEGNEIQEQVPTGFNDNWHLVAFVLSAYDNTATIFVDGAQFRKWNCKADFYANGSNTFFSHLGNYQDLYLGGVAQWTWNDPDPAFAYDDFTIYAGPLDEAQLEVIMKIKHGEIDDDTKLVLAQAEYDAALNEYAEFVFNLESYPTLLAQMDAVIEYYDEIVSVNPTVEKYTQAANDIRAKIAELTVIYNACQQAIDAINDEKAYADATNYPGVDTYKNVLSELTANLSNPSSVEQAEQAMEQLKTAKGQYVISQTMPTDGTGINATALVLHPWFCNPDAEPTLTDGNYVFPYQTEHSYAENTTPADQNAKGWVNGNSFAVDDARVNWTEGRITWNNWHNKTNVGTLDVHQTLTGLPEGYYSVSADWITNAAPTTQHTYATSGGVTKVSTYLDNQGWDTQTWTTLTTDKVYVGEDGELIIGGESSTIGQPYQGWFCVTNFVLTYYGKTIDLNAEVEEKVAEVQQLINNNLVMKGNINNANAKVNEIKALEDKYEAVNQLTQLINQVKEIKAEEDVVFNTINKFNATEATSANVKAVVNKVGASLNEMAAADDATYEMKDFVNNIIAAANAYTQIIPAAEDWNTTETTELLNSQISELNSVEPTPELLNNYAEALMLSMKQSLSTKDASEDNPVDVTAFLVNSSFTGDSWTGWTSDGPAPGIAYSEAEFFNTNFDFYQIVTNLPTGYYKFAAQAFYRDGSNEEAYNKSIAVDEENNPAPANVLNAKIYAAEEVSDIQSWSLFRTVGEEIVDFFSPNATDETVEADQIIYFANAMSSANFFFDTKKMNPDGSFVEFVLKTAGDVRMGVKKETTITNDWTIFDNFHLYYTGPLTEDDVTGINNINTNMQTNEIYNINGVRINSLQKGINIVRKADGSAVKVFVK